MKYFLHIAVLLLTATASFASSGVAYQRFTHPEGDYALTFPVAWRTSWDIKTETFAYPAGKEVRIEISRYPSHSGHSATPEAFIEGVFADVKLYGGQLGPREKITVSGRTAERLQTTLKHGWVDKAKSYTSDRLISHVDIIVPQVAKYFVLSLSGGVGDVALIRPEFDRLVSSFQLGEERPYLAEWRGQQDGPQAATMMVARNQDELRRIISVFGLMAVSKFYSTSGFDFGKHMLVAISMGQQPTGGYTVSIEDAVEREGVLTVRYRERAPKADFVTQALTFPYHLKLLPTSKAAKVRFEKIMDDRQM